MEITKYVVRDEQHVRRVVGDLVDMCRMMEVLFAVVRVLDEPPIRIGEVVEVIERCLPPGFPVRMQPRHPAMWEEVDVLELWPDPEMTSEGMRHGLRIMLEALVKSFRA